MIIRVLPSENYLEKILIALETYEDISKVKVILPTVAACLKLQYMIIRKSPQGACFLPQIVPIINVGIGSEGIYNIPKEAVEPLSLLEQKILIAKLILLNKPDTTISQSLTLANHIIRLFDELAACDVEFNELHLDIPINDAGHWQYMLEFLLKIRTKWTDIQVDLQKTDMAGYRRNMLQMEVNSAKSGNNIIVAGIIPRGKLVTELLSAAYNSPHATLILPQMIPSKLAEDVPVTHKMWLSQLCSKFISPLGDESNKPFNIPETTHKTMVAPNLLVEAKNIAYQATEWISQGVIKIAIVTQNTDLINMVSSILDIEKVEHINISGYMLSRTKQYEFFLLLIKVFDSPHLLNLENTIALFKSPYIFNKDIIDFEYEIRKQQISSDEEFEKWIQNAPVTLPQLKELFTILPQLQQHDVTNITIILRAHIILAEKLAPTLWNGEVGKVFSELLYDLLQIEDLFECNIKDYVEFLEQTIIGARYFKALSNQPILFMNLEEASLGGYEHIICADMNEGSMPRSVPYDPWMNTQMRVTLGLPDVAENIGIDWCYFSNLLHRKNVFLTRSLKVGGRDTVPSRFWRDVIKSSEDIVYKACEIDFIGNTIDETISKPYTEDLFPAKISATNLELLIRNPYGFYAKYILKLRKLENIFDQSNLAKFGNFVHKTIEIYTNEYNSNIPEKHAFIMEIGYKVAAEYSKAKTNLWWPKFTAVMKAFIIFDEERRADGRKIFSEIEGVMPITIGNKTVTITAIADRVEQDNKGNVYILDYKTGTLPTKQDIIRGISVQMIAEAMIVEVNGFKEVSGVAYELTYVKITSREPYIEIVTYKVDELDLAAHKEGLYKVLEAAIKGNFPINENAKFAPKYNDYKHLARSG